MNGQRKEMNPIEPDLDLAPEWLIAVLEEHEGEPEDLELDGTDTEPSTLGFV